LRIAILSPFVDRRHGTERALAELLERLVRNYACEIHLYAQNVADLAVTPSDKPSDGSPTCVVWHRVPKIPGPHLLQFLFWVIVNRLCRLRDELVHGIQFDAVFSPGINALDTDVILVHVLFHRLKELQDAHPQSGLRGLHRSLYYKMLCFLEHHVYRQSHLRLAAVSRHTATQLNHYFGRHDVVIIPNGVDLSHFSPGNRLAMRAAARQKLRYSPEDVVLLLVGNDLRNKGLPLLLDSLSRCRNLPLRLCVVGSDASPDGAERVGLLQLQDRVTFAGETAEILAFYAAADICVAPSWEDSFNLPALEAMASGLPVVVSTKAGISEYLSDGVDSLLLPELENPLPLCDILSRLAQDSELRRNLGQNATQTATRLSWDRHAGAIYALLSVNRHCV
jgi:glycosyltransferase involved in cell wall biosynthesis